LNAGRVGNGEMTENVSCHDRENRSMKAQKNKPRFDSKPFQD